MSDLHARLVAAVEHRLELARAANLLPDSTWYSLEDLAGPQPRNAGLNVQDARFIVANDPLAVTRHAEADLQRLERHQPNAVESEAAGLCAYGWHEVWPCDEIGRIAAAYGVALSPTPSTPEETP